MYLRRPIPLGVGSSTGIDIEGYKCRKCGNIIYLGEDCDYEFESKIKQWKSIEDCNWKLGLEIPK